MRIRTISLEKKKKAIKKVQTENEPKIFFSHIEFILLRISMGSTESGGEDEKNEKNSKARRQVRRTIHQGVWTP